MSAELIATIERAADELSALGHVLQAITRADTLDHAKALAAIGEEHATMRAEWLRDVIASGGRRREACSMTSGSAGNA